MWDKVRWTLVILVAVAAAVLHVVNNGRPEAAVVDAVELSLVAAQGEAYAAGEEHLGGALAHVRWCREHGQMVELVGKLGGVVVAPTTGPVWKGDI
jgi:hypothetical protein